MNLEDFIKAARLAKKKGLKTGDTVAVFQSGNRVVLTDYQEGTLAFTDDDLKRLKEQNKCRITTEDVLMFPCDKLDALIARLEAAEKIVDAAWDLHTGQLDSCEFYMGPWFEAWRKAAGK